MAKNGRFIVLEGPDGCGKSTQTSRLADRLTATGRQVERVRDPGGTPIGEEIRDILLNPDFHEMSVRTEMLLYMASRAQLVEQCIRPALEVGRIILSDRYLTSTLVYQGLAGGLDIEVINRLYAYACGETRPDLVIVLDVPTDVGRSRLSGRPDRMESKSVEFHEKVRQGYLTVAELDPDRHVVIDARSSVDEVAEAAWKAVEHVL